jgi:hypothetical protein
MKLQPGRFLLAALVAVCMTPAPGTAQDKGLKGKLQADPKSPEGRIEIALFTAANAGIPVSLLESKVREGEAKQIPVERIAHAVETRLAALIRADQVLRRAELKTRNAGELSVAADALQAGVTDEVLVRITRTAPEDRRAIATAVLTQLVQLGFESESAFTRVTAALSGGAEALANLRAEVAASLRIKGLL